jgi:hypothetical protein
MNTALFATCRWRDSVSSRPGGTMHPVAVWIGLIVAEAGFGIVMPSMLEATLGGVDAQQAELSSGVVISTSQIAAALGLGKAAGLFRAGET